MSCDDVTVPDGLDLSPAHWSQLLASAISPEVALERGYRTVTKKTELRRLGFQDYQCRAPALFVPVRGPSGEISSYQLRADEPRISASGKPVKYETPGLSLMRLDVPLRTRAVLRDPKVDLYITEGVKKADAGVSAGLHVIAILGVWNWRGTNDQGGKTVLAEFEDIGLNGRRVYLVFDSDVMSKPGVHAALTRLKAWLETREASVRVVYLPDGPNGSKVGLDDFLAAGGTVDQLPGLAKADLDPLPPEVTGEPAPGEFYVDGGETWWMKPVQFTAIPVKLANFTARITGDVAVDDGLEIRRECDIEATLGEVTKTFSVPAQSFMAMHWPMVELGAQAIVSPGFSSKDYLRVAIQTTSGDIEQKSVYGHSGWRDVPGVGWVYLHAAGAVGQVGQVPTIGVRLYGAGGDMLLPEPPSGDELVACIRAVVRLLDLGPPATFYILIATAFRAALGDTDFAVIVHGKTGTQKTECAAIIQSFFGTEFNARRIPGSWTSTANALEMLAFLFKDAVLLVDDFVADGSRQDIQRQMQTVHRMLRAQGNRAGRGRLTSEARLKEGRPPRGLLLSTCEELPTRTSALARAMVLEAPKVDLDVLTECQGGVEKGTYARAMSAFLMWVAGQYPEIKKSLGERSREVRDQAQRADGHKRTPSIVGSLQAGFEVFVDFAESVGVFSADEAVEHRDACLGALLDAGAEQAAHQAETKPAILFVRFVASAIASGQAHLAAMDGSIPSNPESFGWRAASSGTDSFSGTQLRGQGTLIGWVEGENLYLDPDASLKACAAMSSDSERLSVTARTLSECLDEEKLLLSKEPGRKTRLVRRTICGKRPYVLHMGVGVVLGTAQPAQPAQTPTEGPENGDSAPESWAVLHREPANLEQEDHALFTTSLASILGDGQVGQVGQDSDRDTPMGPDVDEDPADACPTNVASDPGVDGRGESDADEWGVL